MVSRPGKGKVKKGERVRIGEREREEGKWKEDGEGGRKKRERRADERG